MQLHNIVLQHGSNIEQKVKVLLLSTAKAVLITHYSYSVY